MEYNLNYLLDSATRNHCLIFIFMQMYLKQYELYTA